MPGRRCESCDGPEGRSGVAERKDREQMAEGADEHMEEEREDKTRNAAAGGCWVRGDGGELAGSEVECGQIPQERPRAGGDNGHVRVRSWQPELQTSDEPDSARELVVRI